MKRVIASNGSGVRYVLHYGAPFNTQTKTFRNKADLAAFLREHVFSDPRYCSVEEVRTLDVNFNFVDDTKVKDKELHDKLFHKGYATLEEWNSRKE